MADDKSTEQEMLDKLFIKLTTWLGESEKSTSETTYRKDSREDMKFYSGDQDDVDTLKKLADLKRPATVYNEIKPKIEGK